MSFAMAAQNIQVIAVITDRIVRDTSSITLESCNYDNLGVLMEEKMTPELQEIKQNADPEAIFYYLINRSKTKAIAMFRKKSQICRTSSWADGENFPIIYFRN